MDPMYTPPGNGPLHGGDIYAQARRMRLAPDKLLDFSSNANIFAYKLTERLLAETPYPFVYYPDSSAHMLTGALAAYEQIEADRILAGNGAAELIWLLLQGLAPRKVLFIGPVFSEYVRACHTLDIAYTILTPPAENDFVCTPENLEQMWESDADLVVICNPNNPAAVTYPNMATMLHMLRAPRVLIDMSYREFLYGTQDYDANSPSLYAQHLRPGVALFTLHSFTKFFCCPGVRLGYLTGDRNQIARMAAFQPSWSVNPFAQRMGQVFLAHTDAYRGTLDKVRAAVGYLGRELRRLACVRAERVFEGPGFVCCGLAPGFSAPQVTESLLQLRYLVRNCDSIPGMPPGYIRMQARPEEDAAQLLAALDSLRKQQS